MCLEYHPHRYWELRGKTYLREEHEGDEERGFWIEDLVNRLEPRLVLEVGCGPGKYLQRHVASPLRTAIDFSISAISTIPDKHGCEILQADVNHIGFRDLSFDFSFTCAVLVHVPHSQIDGAVAELCRVTRKNVLIMEYWDPEMEIRQLAPHCFRHNYPEKFMANGFRIEDRKRLQALIGLFLFRRRGV